MKPASNSARRAQPLLGTFVEIATRDAPHHHMDAAIDAAFRAVGKVHRLMSFHEPVSDVSRLNGYAATYPVTVDLWTYQVLEMALDINRRSAGAFDIAVAPIMQGLGLLPCGSEERRLRSSATSNSDAIELLPDRRVLFHSPGIGIDLGGIAKGFAVDRAVDVLREHGIMHGLVNAGGDTAVFGSGADTIDIRDPRNPRVVMCRLGISGEALATTAGRFDPFQTYNADGPLVIDPRIGKPATSIIGATVRAPTCVVADALTKVVMINGEASAALLEYCSASAMFISVNGSVHVTSDWPEGTPLAA